MGGVAVGQSMSNELKGTADGAYMDREFDAWEKAQEEAAKPKKKKK